MMTDRHYIYEALRSEDRAVPHLRLVNKRFFSPQAHGSEHDVGPRNKHSPLIPVCQPLGPLLHKKCITDLLYGLINIQMRKIKLIKVKFSFIYNNTNNNVYK